LGYDLTDKHTTVASYGGVGVKPPTCITVKVENQMNQISMPKSFFALSQTINDNYSSTSGLPLILALPEHQNLS
jgi:hypothetical protein